MTIDKILSIPYKDRPRFIIMPILVLDYEMLEDDIYEINLEDEKNWQGIMVDWRKISMFQPYEGTDNMSSFTMEGLEYVCRVPFDLMFHVLCSKDGINLN